MRSRREILKGAVAAGAIALVPGGIPLFGKASQPSTPVNFDVPAHATDCHTHLFGDPAQYPFADPRQYTPEPATTAELNALHKALHTQRVVLVQPSVYGPDNRRTLAGLKELGPSARGIAVINDKTTESALDEMHGAGMRGIRLNIQVTGPLDLDLARKQFQVAVDRLKSRPHWHIQMYTRLAVIEGIKDQVLAAPMPVVFDHFGGAQASLGLHQPGFDTLVNLVHSGHAYVKLSAPYRSSTQPPAYTDVAPLAQALIAANPQRMVWGTDWPHPAPGADPKLKYTDIQPPFKVDDGILFNQFQVWAPEASLRKTILVDNPAKLYEF